MNLVLSSFFKLLGLLLFYPVLLVAWVEHRFRGTPPPLEPWAPVIKRVYEWEEKAFCDHCDTVTTHNYIEWTALDGFCVTDTCKWCGIEVVNDIATRFE